MGEEYAIEAEEQAEVALSTHGSGHRAHGEKISGATKGGGGGGMGQKKNHKALEKERARQDAEAAAALVHGKISKLGDKGSGDAGCRLGQFGKPGMLTAQEMMDDLNYQNVMLSPLGFGKGAGIRGEIATHKGSGDADESEERDFRDRCDTSGEDEDEDEGHLSVTGRLYLRTHVQVFSVLSVTLGTLI